MNEIETCSTFYTNAEIRHAIRLHAQSEYPDEAVGCIVDNSYVELVNEADEPEISFARSDYPADAQAIIHSHTRDHSTAPSRADMESQQATALPWGIIATDGINCSEIQWFGDQVPVPSLLGRKFVSGFTDCWGLVRDVYRTQFGILLQNIPRDENWYKDEPPHEKALDLLGPDRIIETGFRIISMKAARPGDVLLGSIRSTVVNHCGLVLPDGLILHHTDGRLSRREPAANWMKFIRYCVRHESFMKNPDLIPDIGVYR